MVRDRKSKVKIIVLVFAVCLVHGVMQGVHDNYGIMMRGLVETSGISYAYISFCIGTGALVYGLAQPFLGILALKKSNAFVILLGIGLTVAGLILTPLCRNRLSMLLFFGLVLPLGTTGLCFGIPFIIMVPVVIWIGMTNKKNKVVTNQIADENISLAAMLREAFADRNYRRILIGFGTCGFNMSIIESHLFSQYISYGIEKSVASLTLTVYGMATMMGAVLSGYLETRFSMKNVLGTLYAMRVIISLGFLSLPKSTAFAFAATGLLGMCGDATVPPTSGIISRRFGAEKMAVLYGFALIGHQFGAFCSSFLGGLFVKNGMGYEPLWMVNLCLATVAAAASYQIKEK